MLDPDRAEGEALARVCVEKLGGYLRDEGGDQNCAYPSLVTMTDCASAIHRPLGNGKDYADTPTDGGRVSRGDHAESG
jgi:hypothetical protein